MKRFKQYIAVVTGIFILGLALPVSAYAACGNANTPQGQVLQGLSQTGGNCTTTSVDQTISTVIYLLSILAGVAAVIFIIYGGFRYITSAGDSNKVSSAKSTIIYALVGLVIAALASTIVHAILNTGFKL